MKKSQLLSSLYAFILLISAFSANATTINYNFTGTVTDAGNIGGVSALLGEQISGNFSYDTSTIDSNPNSTIGEYYSSAPPPVNIMLPNGSLTFNLGTYIQILTGTSINIAASLPDSTTPGNNIDIDIIFSSLIPFSTALSTDALPSDIDANDFNSITGSFSSFSLANGPAGDPIHFNIETVTAQAVPTPPTIWLFGYGILFLLRRNNMSIFNAKNT